MRFRTTKQIKQIDYLLFVTLYKGKINVTWYALVEQNNIFAKILTNWWPTRVMVRTRVRGNLRMRKQNTKATVPLDVVPERRTKRFPPRFRPVGRFCELRFRYPSSPTGREGEISRPLDHMRQIPFIHSARLIDSTNFYIYSTVF